MSIINRFSLLLLTTLLAAFSTVNSSAQTASGAPNILSPYTMYGFGEMVSPANVSSRMMGGAGVALPMSGEINYLNAASLGAIPQKSALFSFAGEGSNNYSKAYSADRLGNSYLSSTANNNFTLHDVGLAVPLTRGLGFSVSLNPVSTIGYNTSMIDSSRSVINNIGRAVYSYAGEGGVSAVTASVGVRAAKGLFLGASLIYYFGSVDRYYNADIYPLLNNSTYYTLRSYERTNISKVTGAFSFIYATRVSKTGYLSIGSSYQMQAVMDAQHAKEHMINSGSIVDTVSTNYRDTRVVIPAKFTAGLGFTSDKVQLALDYSRQDWRGAYDTDAANTGVRLGIQQEFRLGLGFTPNRSDIRRAMSRWTYKVGLIYSTNYLIKDNQQLDKMAVTLGFDIPLRRYGDNPTKISIGAEVGRQGKLSKNQVQDTYFKIFLGFSFFGDDLWFERRKFD